MRDAEHQKAIKELDRQQQIAAEKEEEVRLLKTQKDAVFQQEQSAMQKVQESTAAIEQFQTQVTALSERSKIGEGKKLAAIKQVERYQNRLKIIARSEAVRIWRIVGMWWLFGSIVLIIVTFFAYYAFSESIISKYRVKSGNVFTSYITLLAIEISAAGFIVRHFWLSESNRKVVEDRSDRNHSEVDLS